MKRQNLGHMSELRAFNDDVLYSLECMDLRPPPSPDLQGS